MKNSVKRIKNFGEMLIPYNTPENEYDMGVMKTEEIVVDGYEMIVYYTKSKFETHCTEIVQIWGKYAVFLPFFVVCKLVKAFFGDEHLSLVELFKDNRKIYCWAVNCNLHGEPIPYPYQREAEECKFEDLKYHYMNQSQVNFY